LSTFQSLPEDFDIIIHLAAFKIPRYGNAVGTLKIITIGSQNVLEFARKTQCKCILASTSDVYGMSPDIPFTEDGNCLIGDTKVPRWAYAVSKLYDEHLVLAYMEDYGFPVSILRFFGSYGPNQHLSWWGGPQSVFIDCILNDKVIPIHGDGSQTRTFTYVAEPRLDYLSICSPNYLHDAHIRLALRLGAHAICEKPLVANPWHLDALKELESESNKRVFGILQVRLHPAISQLKKQIENYPRNSKYQVSLTYCASRGPWYNYSWKGDEDKSGGIATNIGFHFFDLLIWLFGDVQENKVHLIEPNRMAGAIELSKANVSWFLSTERKDLPEHIQKKQRPTYRSIIIDDRELEFSSGFNDLHTVSYTNILAGHGFDMTDARPAIELVYRIRNSKVTSNLDNLHPFVKSCG